MAENIKVSKPKTDCLYCLVYNYFESDEKYAMCTHPAICRGLCSVNIVSKPIGFGIECSCTHCKHYNSKAQLSLFGDYETAVTKTDL